MELNEREWFIQAPWGRICIVAWGDCFAPPVLLHHGERDSAVSFRPLLRLLPQNFYYVAMEIPGNGRSDHFPGGMPITVLDLAHTIEIVRRHFRWEQFIFMAHSFGCTIGRFYNLSHPGRMSRVIELDQITPSLTAEMDQFPRWYEIAYDGYFNKYHIYTSPKEKAPKYTWDQAIKRLGEVRGLSPEAAGNTLQRWSEPTGDGRIRFTIDQRTKHIIRLPYTPEHIKTLFTSIETPALGIIASESIKKGLYKKTPFLLEDYKNYRVKKVSGIHDVHIMKPNEMAPYISQFLLYGTDGLDSKAKL